MRRPILVSTLTACLAVFSTAVWAHPPEAGPLAGLSVLRDGRILAASFGAGRVWAIEPDGTSHVLASGIGGANSLTGQILDITHGTPVEFASGSRFPNSLALGRSGGQRFLTVAETLANRVSRLPLADGPSNLAFGRGQGFKRRDVYLANLEPLLGDGTTLVRFSTNHSGARLRR